MDIVIVFVCLLRLSQPPQTLMDLGESLKLLETLQADLSKIESQIPPIHEQFAILTKYEVTVDPAVSALTLSHTHSPSGVPVRMPPIYSFISCLHSIFDYAFIRLGTLRFALFLSVSVGVGVAGGSECRVGVVPAGCD